MRVTFLEGKPRIMENGVALPPTPINIKFAQRLVLKIREAMQNGTFSMAEFFPESGKAGAPMTVGAQMKAWLEGQRIEASTRAGYESAIRFWEPAAGKDGIPVAARALRMLRVSHINIVLASRRELTGKTVNNYVSVLREALESAVDDQILTLNPADKIKRAVHQKPLPDPFTLAEVEAIVADMAAHYPEPVYNMIEWWFFTGLRPSELVGLRWPSVDSASSYVQVKEANVRGIEKNRTKTSVERQVQMNSRARAALIRQRKHTQLADGHVFLDPRYGTPWTDERAFRRSYWAPTLKRLGIRYRSQRHCRHTYATMMLHANRTPAWCAKQMGHSVEMFYRTYTKWIQGEQDDQEIQGMEAWLATQKDRAPKIA